MTLLVSRHSPPPSGSERANGGRGIVVEGLGANGNDQGTCLGCPKTRGGRRGEGDKGDLGTKTSLKGVPPLRKARR